MLTGGAATGSVGSVKALITPALSGVASAASAGSVAPSNAKSLVGDTTTTSPGTLVFTPTTVLLLSRNAGITSVAQLAPSVVKGLSGVTGTSSPGTAIGAVTGDGVVGNQLMLPPTPVATVVTPDTAVASQAMAPFVQFYSVGYLQLHQPVSLMDSFDQYATLNGGIGPYTQSVVQVNWMDPITQAATVTTPHVCAAAQALGSFGQVATASTLITDHAVSSTALIFAQVATIKIIEALVANEPLPTFTQGAAASSVHYVVGVQALASFTQAASIPGYANFVPNERTLKVNPENRVQQPNEDRINQILVESRGVQWGAENRDNAINEEDRVVALD